jgi:ribulose-phosphate 3-epimerase
LKFSRDIMMGPSNSSSALVNAILVKLQLRVGEKRSNNIQVIGIDGPTAAGKTIFAKTLKDSFEKLGYSTWIFQLDWTLVARHERVSDLEFLKQSDEHFLHEAELHMRMEKAVAFLIQIRAFNEKLEHNASATQNVELKGLYSRDHDGQEVAEAECKLRAGMIILVEGHYTLRTELDKLIDFNILMMSEKKELLKRKIARVKGYRSAIAAEEYFNKIDVPSFAHHLSRFYQNADFVVENTDYLSPSVQRLVDSVHWIDPPKYEEKTVNFILGYKAIGEHALGKSIRIPEEIRNSVDLTLEALLRWDFEVGQRFRNSITDVNVSLSTQIDSWVAEVNSKFEKPYRLTVGHTNALHNVYFRHLPVSLGVSIKNDEEIAIGLLADVLPDSFQITIIWPGGINSYAIKRDIGTFKDNEKFYVINRDLPQQDNKKIQVLTPTEIMLPPFLKGLDVDLVFTGREDENISASEALSRVLSSGGVWIHRFALFEEINYFLWLVERCGMSAVKIGNYLIVAYDTKGQIRDGIQKFISNWKEAINDVKVSQQDEREMDKFIIEGRAEADIFVRTNCPNFISLDNHIFCPAFSLDKQRGAKILAELRLMLQSNNRMLRKKAYRFIQQKAPDLKIDVSALWLDLKDSDKQISLQTISKISPSILSEIYLWLSIREDPSAVLGANIYDISEDSLDCSAYLGETARRHTAIVLQSSFNAIGQKEFEGEAEKWGYLKPNNGVETFAKSAMKAARDVILENADSPLLFSIGLDHIDYRNDMPSGRARRFVEQAVQSEQITHFVLDGSALFKADDRSKETLDQAFKSVLQYAVDLLPDSMSPIMDFEFCFGELNYVDNDSQPMLPQANEMVQVAKICRDILHESGFGAINARPKLYIGNLGTTHHGADSTKPQTQLARNWVDATRRYKFISAVLHGTTGTNSNVLSEASDGCHKVNVAGDLLHTFIVNLPQVNQTKILENHPGAEAKKGLHLVRSEVAKLDEAKRDQIRNELGKHCGKLMETINSPKLSKGDVAYFQYRLYKFSDFQIDCILDKFSKSHIVPKIFDPSELTAPNVKHAFSASLIEVPFGSEFKEITGLLWDEGIDNFHVDVGDGKLIPRTINALDKIVYLRSSFPDSQIHAHLMVQSPHHSGYEGSLSCIEAYAKAGVDAIAVHEGAFEKRQEFVDAIMSIRKCGKKPGLIIETNQDMTISLFNTLKDLKIDWVVVMGVVIGFGGQIFDSSTFGRIAALRNYALAEEIELLIEVDGGLTTEIIPQCLVNGSQLLAGWSIIRGQDKNELRDKIRHVNSIIGQVTGY